MESALSSTEEGRKRLRQAEERMTVMVAMHLQEQDSRRSGEGQYHEGGSSGAGSKRGRDQDNVSNDKTANVSPKDSSVRVVVDQSNNAANGCGTTGNLVVACW